MAEGTRARSEDSRAANLTTHRGQAIKLESLLDESDEKTLAAWQRRINHPDALVVLDLFCGAGGMSLGFEEAGFVVAAGIDSDARACETHAANFHARTRCLDLSKITSHVQARAVLDELGIGRIDVIVGGPPCQGVSAVGRARIRTLPKEEQRQVILSRNNLYQPFFHFVEAARPLLFVLENVPAVQSWDDGVLFATMLDRATELGYHRRHRSLNAAWFGVPQTRHRRFIVGDRTGGGFCFPLRTDAGAVTLQEAIGDLPAVAAPSLVEDLAYVPRQTGHYQRLMRRHVSPTEGGVVHDHVVRPVRADDRLAFDGLEPGQRYTDLPAELQRYSTDSFPDKYYKLRPDAPCITITAHMAKDGYRYIHWDRAQCRTLSVREAARVQSFHDAFRFAGHRTRRFRQIGNAVPPLLAHAIAVNVRREIESYRARRAIEETMPRQEYLHLADSAEEGVCAR